MGVILTFVCLFKKIQFTEPITKSLYPLLILTCKNQFDEKEFGKIV